MVVKLKKVKVGRNIERFTEIIPLEAVPIQESRGLKLIHRVIPSPPFFRPFPPLFDMEITVFDLRFAWQFK